MTAAGIFAALCLAFGINGLLSLENIADPVQHTDAAGFAWFWIFLGVVGLVIAVAGWWLARGYRTGQDA